MLPLGNITFNYFVKVENHNVSSIHYLKSTNNPDLMAQQMSGKQLKKMLTHKIMTMDGKQTIVCTKRKRDWYIDHGLATEIDENTIRLKFAHKQKGEDYTYNDNKNCANCNDECETKINLCYVVPKDYAKEMNKLGFKVLNNCIMLCDECNDLHGANVNILRNQLNKELDEKTYVITDSANTFCQNDYFDIHNQSKPKLLKIQKQISLYLKFKNKQMDQIEKQKIVDNLQPYMNNKITIEDLDKLSFCLKHIANIIVDKYAKAGKLLELQNKCRNAFVELKKIGNKNSDDSDDEQKIKSDEDSYIMPLTDAEDDD